MKVEVFTTFGKKVYDIPNYRNYVPRVKKVGGMYIIYLLNVPTGYSFNDRQYALKFAKNISQWEYYYNFYNKQINIHKYEQKHLNK